MMKKKASYMNKKKGRRRKVIKGSSSVHHASHKRGTLKLLSRFELRESQSNER
jgi:hypothetical protein